MRRRKAHSPSRGRFSRIELLEPRQMMAGDSRHYVISTLDDVAQVGTAADEQWSLREALADSAVNWADVDLITFDPTLFAAGNARIDLTLGALVVNSPIDIVGPGAGRLTISADGSHRVFNTNNDEYSGVTIRDMTIEGGGGVQYGGGVHNTGLLTLSSVVVTGNEAYLGGGGVYSDGASLRIEKSTISNNEAGWGGGVRGDLAANEKVEIVDSAILENVADHAGSEYGSGGAVLIGVPANTTPTVTNLQILNSTLGKNEAENVGGGVYIANGASAKIVNATITENTADGVGGGLYVAEGVSGRMTMQNTIIAENTDAALSSTVDVYSNSSSVTPLTADSKFNLVGVNHPWLGLPTTDNLYGDSTTPQDPQLLALGDYGGPTKSYALDPASDAIDYGSNAYATSAGLINDQRGASFPRALDASVDLGAIESRTIYVVTTHLDVVNASDGLLSLREAITAAHDLYELDDIEFSPDVIAHGEVLLNSIIYINTPLNIRGAGADKLVINAQGTSQAFKVNTYGDVSIRDLTITGGYSIAGGGAIVVDGDLALDGVVMRNNQAGNGGGAVYVSPTGSLNVNASTFYENDAGAGKSGGAISGQFGAGKALTISNSTFYENTASTGGAIKVMGNNGGTATQVLITNSTISGNTGDSGGGINFQSFAGCPVDAKIINTTIAYNEATTSVAGGIFNVNPDRITVTLHNTILAKNQSADPNYQDSWGSLAGKVTSPSSNNLIGFSAPFHGSGIPNDPDGTGKGNKVGTTVAIDPMITPLGDFGGPALTHALLPNSPAIDGADYRVASVYEADVAQTGVSQHFDIASVGLPGKWADIGSASFAGSSFVVDTNSDLDNQQHLPGDRSLREAIRLARASATDVTISFASSVGDTISLTQPLVVYGNGYNLSIEGPGADYLAVDGGQELTSFTGGFNLIEVRNSVPSSDRDLTISGLTLKRGLNAVYQQGGPYTSVPEVVLDGVVLSENKRGVLSESVVTIIDSTVKGSYGPGVDGGNLTILNSSIVDNGGVGVYADWGQTTITNSSIERNNQRGSGTGVGGVDVGPNGDLQVTGSTIANNVGKGINVLYAEAELTNTTISGNYTGLYAGFAGNVTLTNVTVTENWADRTAGSSAAAGGLYADAAGSILMRNTIAAGNVAGADRHAADLGRYTSTYYNGSIQATSSMVDAIGNSGVTATTTNKNILLEGADAGLAPLDNYGGPTRTHGLMASSPAIDRGDDTLDPNVDQRGLARHDDPDFGGVSDIGAFEYRPEYVVNTLADGAGNPDQLTLRQAIAAARTTLASDVITFAPGLFGATPATILLQDVTGDGASDELVIDSSVTIVGPGAGKLSISGGGESRVFRVDSGVQASLTGITITGGASAIGGGIHNQGDLTLIDDVLTGNNAGYGGAIANLGSLTLVRTQIADNTAYSSGGGIIVGFAAPGGHATITDSAIVNNTTIAGIGGGIFVGSSGYLDLRNSTISTNHAPGTGGGIAIQGGAQIDNSTIAENTVLSSGNAGGAGLSIDPVGSVFMNSTIVALNRGSGGLADEALDILGALQTASANNLIGDGAPGAGGLSTEQNNNRIASDPRLLPLGDYGGPTLTHALREDSPAIDQGRLTFESARDQRGFVRYDQPGLGRGIVDVGAFEYVGALRVNTLNDESPHLAAGELTLRQALWQAEETADPDTIDVSGLVGAIYLSGDRGQLVVGSNVTIVGPGADRLAVDALGRSRVFYIAPGVAATISGLTVRGGNADAGLPPSSQQRGGGFSVAGQLTLNGVEIRDNKAYTAAGISLEAFVGASLNVQNSTIAQNTATYSSGVGGVQAHQISGLGSQTFINVTISNNVGHGYQWGWISGGPPPGGSSPLFTNVTVANNVGIGIAAGSTIPVRLNNSIVVGNDGPAAVDYDVTGTFISSVSTYNIIGAQLSGVSTAAAYHNYVGSNAASQVNLQPLDYYGGPTRTRLPIGAIAIDVAPNLGAPATDQRGVPRPVDVDNPGPTDFTTDIGAVEVAPTTLDLNGAPDGTAVSSIFVATKSATVIAPNGLISGYGNLESLTVRINNRLDGSREWLSMIPVTGLTAKYENGVLTINGSASTAVYQQALRSIHYSNTSSRPNITPRNLTFELRQGSRLAATAEATVNTYFEATVELDAISDVFVDEFNLAGIDGQTPDLFVASTDYQTAYFRFQLPATMVKATKAELDLYTATVNSATTGSAPVGVYSFTPYWNGQLHLSWDEDLNPPDHSLAYLSGPNPLLTTLTATARRHGIANVTAAAAGLSGGASLSLALASETHYVAIASSEASDASQRPKLYVTGLFADAPPEALPDYYQGAKAGVAFNVTAAQGVLANDSDPEGSQLTAHLVQGPEHGVLSLSPSGAFTYTPDPMAGQSASFTYQAFDGVSFSNPQVVRIGLSPATTKTYETNQYMTVRGEDDIVRVPWLATSPGEPFLGWNWDYHTYVDTEDGAVAYGNWWGGGPLGIPEYTSYVKYGVGDLQFIDWTQVVSAKLVLQERPSGPYGPIGEVRLLAGLADPRALFSPLYFGFTEEVRDALQSESLYSFSGIMDDWTETITVPPYNQSQIIANIVGDNSAAIGGYTKDESTGLTEVDVTEYVRQQIRFHDYQITIGIAGGNLASIGFEFMPELLITYVGKADDPLPPDDPNSTNSAPQFISPHIREAKIGQVYSYTMAARDDDGDELEYGVPHATIQWPADYTPKESDFPTVIQERDVTGRLKPTAVMQWNPSKELNGKTVRFRELVRDEVGHLVPRDFDVLVQHDPQNNPPVIGGNAMPTFDLPEQVTSFPSPVGQVSPAYIDVVLAEGQVERFQVVITENATDLRSEMVFVIDDSGSMMHGFNFVDRILPTIDAALAAAGFKDRQYGLAYFAGLPDDTEALRPVIVNPGATGAGHEPDDVYWGSAADLDLWLDFEEHAGFEDGYLALDDLLGVSNDSLAYQFDRKRTIDNTVLPPDPAKTSEQVILITDEAVSRYKINDLALDSRPDDDPDKIAAIKALQDEKRQKREDLLRGFFRIEPDQTDQLKTDNITLTTIVASRYAGTSTGDKPPGFLETSGDWRIRDGSYQPTQGAGLHLTVVEPHLERALISYGDRFLKASLQISAPGKAYVIFDYQDPHHYKYLSATTTSINPGAAVTWHLGEVNGPLPSNIIETEIGRTEDFDFGAVHQVVIHIGALAEGFQTSSEYYGPVRVAVDNTNLSPDVELNFNNSSDNLWDGRVGLGVTGQSARFMGLAVSADPKPINDVFDPEAALRDYADHTDLDRIIEPYDQGLYLPGADKIRSPYVHDLFLNGADNIHYLFGITEAGDGALVYPVLGYSPERAYLYDEDHPAAGTPTVRRPEVADGQFAFVGESSSEFSAESYSTIHDDYATLALETGGSTWDLSLLRDEEFLQPLVPGGNSLVGTSFSTAFVDAVAAQAKRSIGPLVATPQDGNAIVNGLTLDRTASGGVTYYTLELKGDGAAHYTFIDFSRDGGLPISLPIRITTPYVADLYVEDPDGIGPYEYDVVVTPTQEGIHKPELVHNGGTTAQLRWVPPDVTDATDFHFSVMVRDVNGLPARQPYAWTVKVQPDQDNLRPELPLPEDVVLRTEKGRGFRERIVATDPNAGDRLRYFLDDAPPGMSIDYVTGVVEWAVPNNWSGDANFTVRVVDGRLIESSPGGPLVQSNDIQEYTITVTDRTYVNVAPQITPILNQTITLGGTLWVKVVADDRNHDTPIYDLVNPVDDGMSINPVTGVLTWTPTKPSQAKVYPDIIVRVTDGHLSSTRSFSLTVNPANVAPVLRSELAPALVNLSYNEPLDLIDPNGDSVVVRTVSLPTGATVDRGADGRWRLNWLKPIAGKHPIKLVADDLHGGVTPLEFDFEVLNYYPPTITGVRDSYVEVDDTFVFEFSITTDGRILKLDDLLGVPSSTDLLSQWLKLDDRAVARGMRFDLSNMSRVVPDIGPDAGRTIYKGLRVEWTPDAEDVDEYDFTITARTRLNPSDLTGASDVWGGGRAYVTVFPAPPAGVNIGPRFTTQALGPFAKGRPFDFTLGVADPDGVAYVTIVEEGTNLSQLDREPELGGNFELQPNGRIVWTPQLSGDYVLTVRAVDKLGASRDQTYFLHVDGNEIPTADWDDNVPVPVAGDPNYVFRFQVYDPNPGDDILVTLNSEAVAAGLQVSRDPNGGPRDWQLTWNVPATAANTEVPLTIKLDDQHGGINRIIFPVLPVLGSPNPTVENAQVPVGRALELGYRIRTATGFAYGYTLEIASPTGASTASATISADGLLEWTPTASEVAAAPHVLTVKIPNPNNPTQTVIVATLSITVVAASSPSGSAPVFNSTPPLVATAGQSLIYEPKLRTASGAGAVLHPSWSLSGLPEGADAYFNPYSGRLSWTADPSLIGETITLELTAVDAMGQVAVQQFPITVRATNERPQFDDIMPRAWAEDLPFNFEVQASDPDGNPLVYGVEGLKADGSPDPTQLWTLDPDPVNPDRLLLQWNHTPNIPERATNYSVVLRVREKYAPDVPDSYVEYPFLLKVSAGVTVEPYFRRSPNGLTASITDSPGEFAFDLQVGFDPSSTGVTFTIEWGQSAANLNQMFVDPSGVFHWKPSAGDVTGPRYITVKATDSLNQVSYLDFTLNVVKNDPPRFMLPPEPVLSASVGSLASHIVEARDPQGGRLTYSLAPLATSDPAYAYQPKIDPVSGVLAWQAPTTESPAGATFATLPKVTVIATDDLGSTASIEVALRTEVDKIRPTISLGVQTPDGRVITPGSEVLFSDVTGEGGGSPMVIAISVSDNSKTTDGPNVIDNAYWRMKVENTGSEETVYYPNSTAYPLGFPPKPAAELTPALLQSASEAGATYLLEPDGLYYAFLRPGDLEVPFDGGANAGLLTVQVVARDAQGNRSERTNRYHVQDPTAGEVGKLQGIYSGDLFKEWTPDSDTIVIDRRVEVYGNANFPRLLEEDFWGDNHDDLFPWDPHDDEPTGTYRLQLISLDNPDDIINLTPNSPEATIQNGYLGSIDPTLIRSGVYRLYLQVECFEGCIEAVDERLVEIRNDVRLGNLDLSFTDMEVDLGGIPVSIVRTYGSSAVGEGNLALANDFGPGWSLNFLQAGVEVSHPRQVSTRLTDPLAKGSRLLIRLPDGSIERFTFDPVRSAGSSYRPRFIPESDAQSTLELAGEAEDVRLWLNSTRNDGTFVLAGSDNVEYVLSEANSALVLRTGGGVSYLFDPTTGKLTAIESDSGQRVNVERGAANLTISAADDSGNSAVSLKKIVVNFDAHGRVSSITDPALQSIVYSYGNFNPKVGSTPHSLLPESGADVGKTGLAQVTSRSSIQVYYDYVHDALLPHHLTDVYDSTDQRVLHAEFALDNSELDPNGVPLGLGRLKTLQSTSSQVATLGFKIQLSGGRTATQVVDSSLPLENQVPVEQVTDARGNVLRTLQPLLTTAGAIDPSRYLVTDSIYDNQGRLTHQSLPYIFDESTSAEGRYDAPTPSTSEVARWARINSYKDGLLATSLDASGGATVYEYDEEDRLVRTRDASGAVTHQVYDLVTGDLLETYVTKGDGPKLNHSRFVYQHGRLIETYQVDGEKETLVSKSDYDLATGRLRWSEDANHFRRYFLYDANGNQTVSFYVWTNPSAPSDKWTVATRTYFNEDGRAGRTREYQINADVSTTLDEASDLDSGFQMLSTTTTDYDDQGRPWRTVDRHGAQTINVYDVAGNVIETRTQAKSATGNGWLVTRTLYDAQGRVKFAGDQYFVTDAQYNAGVSPATSGTRTVYDRLGRVARTERYEAVSITITNNAATTIAIFPGEQGTPNVAFISATKNFYDSLGRVEYSLSETDLRTDYYYDAVGRQAAVLGPQVEVRNSDGTVTLQRMLSTSMSDSAGRITQSATGITLTAAALAVPRPNLYDSATGVFNESLLTRSGQQTTFYEYDIAGRQTAVISTFLKDPDDVAGTADGYHIRTETVYDALGRRIALREGLTQTDPFKPSTISTVGMRETTYEYDGAGNLLAVNLPAIDGQDFGPDAAIGAIQVRPRYEYQYDAFGNRTLITTNAYLRPDGKTVVYLVKSPSGQDQFAAKRDRLSQQPPAKHLTTSTEFKFDHRGRQVTRILPIGVSTTGDQTDFDEQTGYADNEILDSDPNRDRKAGHGQILYTVDFEGRVTGYAYDNTAQGGGRLVSKHYYDTLALFNIDNADQVLASSNRVEYSYDDFGRQSRAATYQAGAEVLREENTFDAEGRLTRVVTRVGPVAGGVTTAVNYEYDRVTGRHIRTYTGNVDADYLPAANEAVTDTRYVYDALGRLSKTVVVERYDADVPATNPLTISWTNKHGVAMPNIDGDITSYFYDAVGNLAHVRYGNGLMTDYRYDELNRLRQQTSYVDGNADHDYDEGETKKGDYRYWLDQFNKRIKAEEIDPQETKTTIDWAYDALGRMTDEKFNFDSLNPANVANDYWAKYEFDYASNRVKKRVDNGAVGATLVADEAFDYYYDSNDRLLRETLDNSAANGTTPDKTTFYEYDDITNPNDNRMGGTAQTRQATYGPGDHTSQPTSGQTSETTYEYNVQGRLKKIRVDADSPLDGGGAATTTTEFEYNDSGFRISQSIGGVKTVYVVDAQNHTGYAQVIEEGIDSNANGALDAANDEIKKSYAIGLDVISQTVAAATTHHLLYDGHGSTRALLDANRNIVVNSAAGAGNLKQLFAYDAYGNLQPLPGYANAAAQAADHILTSLLYSGEQTDRTGLQYLRARYYNPQNGRFNRLDPFAGTFDDPQSLHKYLYASDPINNIDPSGQALLGLLQAIAMQTAAIAGVAGAASGALAGLGANRLGFETSEAISLALQFGTANAIIFGQSRLGAGSLAKNITYPMFNAAFGAVTAVLADSLYSYLGWSSSDSEQITRNGYRTFIETYFDMSLSQLGSVFKVPEFASYAGLSNINNTIKLFADILTNPADNALGDRIVNGFADIAISVVIGSVFNRDTAPTVGIFPANLRAVKRQIERMQTLVAKAGWDKTDLERALRSQFRTHARRSMKAVIFAITGTATDNRAGETGI